MKKIKLFRLNSLFILGIILSVISSFINLFIPLQIKKVIDFKQLISHKISWKLIAGVITLLIISTFVNTLSSFIISKEGDKQIANIRLQVQSHLLKLPISFFNNQISGQLASRVINDSYVVKTFMTQVIPSLINNIITVVGTFTLLFILDWKLTTLVLLGFPLLFSIAFPLGKVMEKLSSRSQEQLSQLTGITTESLQGIRSVKLNMAESGIIDKLKDGTKRMLSDLVRVSFDGKKFTFENVEEALVQYEVVAYGRGLTNDNNIPITNAKEFGEIVKKYSQYIEIDTRLQNLSYSWHVL